MPKIFKYLKKIIKSKFHIKCKFSEIKKIYKDLETGINTQYTNFINNILALDDSNISKYKKLKQYWNYKINEHDIDFINNTLSLEDKKMFLRNEFVTNQKVLIIYKKDFKYFFKHQIYKTPLSSLTPIFRDYVNFSILYSYKNFNVLNFDNQFFLPHEQRLITQNTNNDREYIDYKDIPDDFDIFLTTNNYGSLNFVQRAVSYTALYTNDNFLICAPTGVGKTLIAIMTIFRQLKKCGNTNCRIAYVAPMKSLASEIFTVLQKNFDTLKIYECTSDTHLSKFDILNFNILVGTPEKIEIIMRNNYTLIFNLVIFDEIHILNEPRGYTIESLVMRISHIFSNKCRLVGMSATIYNYEDVGAFLQCASHNIFYFNEEYRPVPLLYELIQSYNFKIDLLDLLKDSVGPHLIFVHTKQDTLEIAEFLSKYETRKRSLKCFIENCQICQINTEKLDKFFVTGIGVHHAGLSKEVKYKVEHLYKSGILDILVSTSTLSYGVNLPIRTVIVLGTKFYNKNIGAYEVLSNMAIKQMLGRAGRNFLSQSEVCKGIVMSETFIDSFFYEQTIESQLLHNLSNVLLSQITHLKSYSEMFTWFTRSYFFIRLRKLNQDYYKYSMDILHTCINDLTDCKMLDRKNQITFIGRINSKYLVNFRDTYYVYKNIKNIMLDGSLLDLLSAFQEFKDVKIKDYLDCNILIPAKTDINKLYQLYISDNIEQCDILDDNLARIFKCMLDISLYKKVYSSRLFLEYYKSAIFKECIYKNPTTLNLSVQCDFFGKFIRLKILPITKHQKYYILIYHDDRLLITDILYNQNIKYYKIPKHAFYEINIINAEVINSSFKKTFKRTESSLNYRVIKLKNRIKPRFLEFYDQINYIMSLIDPMSYILIPDENIAKFFISKYKNINNFDENVKKVHVIDILGNIKDFKKYKKYKNVYFYTNYLYIKVQEDDGFYLSSSSLYYIDLNIKNNMNIKSLIHLVFSLPEMFTEIVDQKYKKFNGNEYGMNCVLFYMSLYGSEDFDSANVKYCLKIILEKASNRGFIKTMLNIVFLLQKINKSDSRTFNIKKNNNFVDINSSLESNFYIFNNQGEYKYLENVKEKIEIELFNGTNYILSDRSTGYDIIN